MRNKFTNKRVPIERSSGFHFDNFEDGKKAFKHLKNKPELKKYLNPPVYTRYGNPSVSSAENALGEMIADLGGEFDLQ